MWKRYYLQVSVEFKIDASCWLVHVIILQTASQPPPPKRASYAGKKMFYRHALQVARKKMPRVTGPYDVNYNCQLQLTFNIAVSRIYILHERFLHWIYFGCVMHVYVYIFFIFPSFERERWAQDDVKMVWFAYAILTLRQNKDLHTAII